VVIELWLEQAAVLGVGRDKDEVEVLARTRLKLQAFANNRLESVLALVALDDVEQL